MQDVMSAALDQGLDPRRDREAYQKLMEGARADVNASIKAVIGDSGGTYQTMGKVRYSGCKGKATFQSMAIL
mgnify:CR=1 FL=1